MINYITDNEIQGVIENNEDLILVFGKGINCGVCHAVEHRVNTDLLKKFPKLKVYYLTVEESPQFRGQHLIFTVPTLMLFDRSREVHRESRIVDFTKLERVLDIYFKE